MISISEAMQNEIMQDIALYLNNSTSEIHNICIGYNGYHIVHFNFGEYKIRTQSINTEDGFGFGVIERGDEAYDLPMTKGMIEVLTELYCYVENTI
jgi:hypothetical protein